MNAGPQERELRESARLLVRSGLSAPDEVDARFRELVSTQFPGPDGAILATAWLHAARREWRSEAESWPTPTDHERWVAAVDDCLAHDVLVLPGTESLADVRAAVDSAGRALRGVLWFSEQAVFHAIDHGVLEVGLRHGTGAPANEGDPLSNALLAVLQNTGLQARAVPGGLQVSMHWCRRP